MSDTAISFFAIARPFSLRTLSVRLFLLTLVSLKLPEVLRLTSTSCGVVVLGSLPRSFSGHSILMISAPNAPSQRVAHGPARTQVKSTTRIFSSARGRAIALFPATINPIRPAYRRSLCGQAPVSVHRIEHGRYSRRHRDRCRLGPGITDGM